ncbi:MAG: EF-Tu/IF-2/RF-3 family GTPase [Thermoplasmatota archaeon]
MGVTAALLGNLAARRNLGKVGTQSDIHLHDLRHGSEQIMVVVPDRYPDSVKPLSYAVGEADVAVLAVDRVSAQLGEQILAANAAAIRKGVVVLQNYVQPDQVKPLLKGTTLEAWPVVGDDSWDQVHEILAQSRPAPVAGPALVPIDHHFNVKGVGAVVLAVVRQGVVRKGETLHAFPDKVICPIRSIQIHDVDVAEAHAGDRVGLALRNTPPELLDRGMILAPADAPLVVHATGSAVSFRLRRSPFSRQPLKAGAVVQVGCGMQFVPLRLTADVAPGAESEVRGTVEKSLVHLPGENAILWHVDAVPQRVVGSLELR